MDERTENNLPALTATGAEKLTALLMYIAAYIYTLCSVSDNKRLWFGVFVLLFVLMVEYIDRGVPRPKESWIWLGCLLLITFCVCIGRGWPAYGESGSPEYSILAVHILAVWWVLSRSGKLAAGESGRLLPLDALNGFIRIPFGNFFLRLRCLGQGIKDLTRGKGRGRSTVFGVAAAIILGALLLWWSVSSLSSADSGFAELTGGILAMFSLEPRERFREFAVRFVLSLPVAAWLFGLIAGSVRMAPEKLRAQREGMESLLRKICIVPAGVWIAVTAVFAAVYLVFFAVQASYLFGAFARRLPEGFIVSEYARRGFFELCRVIVINFTLLWLVTHTSAKPVRGSCAAMVMCTLLLAAGMLFAVVSISKLVLYISCFGFTPKRLQSSWLAMLMLCGCVCAAYSLWTGKKSFRFWMVFGAVTMAFLNLF